MEPNPLIIKVVVVSLLGGVLCLDRVVLQAAIARPVVAASLIGWLNGDAYTGLVIGAFTELFWIDRLPIGAYIPPNETVVAILATAGTLFATPSDVRPPHSLVALSILLFLPVGLIAQHLEYRLAMINEKAIRLAMGSDTQPLRMITRRHSLSILIAFTAASGLILLALLPGTLLLAWGSHRLPTFVSSGLMLLYGVFPLIGCAAALQTIQLRGAIPVFCAFFLVISSLLSWMKGG